jgi:hypothetical protein
MPVPQAILVQGDERVERRNIIKGIQVKSPVIKTAGGIHVRSYGGRLPQQCYSQQEEHCVEKPLCPVEFIVRDTVRRVPLLDRLARHFTLSPEQR